MIGLPPGGVFRHPGTRSSHLADTAGQDLSKTSAKRRPVEPQVVMATGKGNEPAWSVLGGLWEDRRGRFGVTVDVTTIIVK